VSDIRKVKRVAGWEPMTRLEDGVAETVRYYRLHRKHYW